MATTDKSGQIIPAQQHKKTLADQLKRLQPQISAAVPKQVDSGRLARTFLTCLSTTPKLAECTVASFLGSCMQLSQLGLDPTNGLGQAYLIPRRIDGVMQCTTIIGYQGMMDIARRSGKVGNLYAHVVRQGDAFEYELGLHRDVRHKPLMMDGEDFTHVYAVAELEGGYKTFVCLTASQVMKRAASSTAKTGPWKTHREPMFQKTSLRELFKFLPRSTEMATAAAFDEAPDYGERQTRFLSPEARAALEAHGIDTESDETAGGGEAA